MFKKLKQLSGYQWFLIIFCVLIASLSLNALIGIKRLEHGGSRSHPVSVCELRGHNLTYHAQSTPTCTSTGYYSTSCYECTVCGLFFSDSTGENRISSPYVRHTPGHSVVCFAEELGANDDYSADWQVDCYCSVCDAEISSEVYQTCSAGLLNSELFEDDFSLIGYVAGKFSFAGAEYRDYVSADDYLIMSYPSLSCSFLVPVLEPYSIGNFSIGDVVFLSGSYVNTGMDNWCYGFGTDVVIEKLGYNPDFVETLGSLTIYSASSCDTVDDYGGLHSFPTPLVWSDGEFVSFIPYDYYYDTDDTVFEGYNLHFLKSDLLQSNPGLFDGTKFYGETLSSSISEPYVDVVCFIVYKDETDVIFKVVSFSQSER